MAKPCLNLTLETDAMPERTTPDAPLAAPAIEEATASDIRPESAVIEESQVIVHCRYRATWLADGIRIWPSTFLISKDCGHRSELLHTENITRYPHWTWIIPGRTLRFTLIFSGLPKSCTAFDLVEVIPEPGGFEVRDIKRNRMDVYEVEIT